MSIKFYWNTVASIFVHIVHGFLGTVTGELSSYDRDLLARKTSLNIYSLALYKSWLTPVLECQDSPTQMLSMDSLSCFQRIDKKAV